MIKVNKKVFLFVNGAIAVFEDLHGNRWDLVELVPGHPLAGR